MSVAIPLSISNALQWATAQLVSVTELVELEAELLLANVLKTSRAHLHAWPERLLDEIEHNHFLQFVSRRIAGEPIAYVTGKREFWSLELNVTPDVLIPRPETELLVDIALKKLGDESIRTVADLGTGSGAIALALAQENPEWVVHATDRCQKALVVAKENSENLQLKNIKFHQGFWCAALPHLRYDAIISNPPYIAEGDPEVENHVLQNEPIGALLSGKDGLNDIRHIIEEAKNYLQSNGYLMLEHGYQQAAAVRALMQAAGYAEIQTLQDLAGQDRVTLGQFQTVKIA